MRVDVTDDNSRPRIIVDCSGVVEEAERDVACSAGDVEVGLRVGGRAGVEGADEVVFPEAVGVEGHEVVHGVVGGGDGGEDGGDLGERLVR